MIITLAEAKEYLRVDVDDEDALIETLRLDTEEFESAGDVAKIAVLFVLGYFYEHREDADHKALTLTLRSLLHGVRKAAF